MCADVREKGVEKLICLQIVLPNVTAPPQFRIFDFRKNPERLDRLKHAVVREASRRAGAADDRVEIIDSRFLLSGDAACVLRPGRGNKLRVEAKPLL